MALTSLPDRRKKIGLSILDALLQVQYRLMAEMDTTSLPFFV